MAIWPDRLTSRQVKRIEEVDSAWSHGHTVWRTLNHADIASNTAPGDTAYTGDPVPRTCLQPIHERTYTTSARLVVFEGLIALAESKLAVSVVDSLYSGRQDMHAKQRGKCDTWATLVFGERYCRVGNKEEMVGNLRVAETNTEFAGGEAPRTTKGQGRGTGNGARANQQELVHSNHKPSHSLPTVEQRLGMKGGAGQQYLDLNSYSVAIRSPLKRSGSSSVRLSEAQPFHPPDEWTGVWGNGTEDSRLGTHAGEHMREGPIPHRVY
ncbi:hypothetical protein EI94DRAFT_1785460 [Lactarius quietus]|nr:hypothetical protein EI94DRAFT_1785460 [Lactarius quietus]